MSCPHCDSKYSTTVKRKWPDGKFDWMCSSCGRQVDEPEGLTVLKPEEQQPEAGEVVLYDRMVLAINECHQTDQVKEIRDQALALETYAKQAQNQEAEQKAIEIRIRAERRAGELLKALEKQPGKRTDLTSVQATPRLSEDADLNSAQAAPSLFAQAKEQAKISDDQAKRWQKLAEIPKDEFEQALKAPETKPSTSGLIKSALFKPIAPTPIPKLDKNPRRCTASCCQPDGSDIVGPWNVHDAQALLDQGDFRYGFFKEHHKSILDFGVDCRLERAIEQFRGGLARGSRGDHTSLEYFRRGYDGMVLK